MTRLLLWGCGENGGIAHSLLKENPRYKIEGWIDSNTEKQGGLYLGKKIYSPKEGVEKILNGEADVIVATMAFRKIWDIRNFARANGLDYIYYLEDETYEKNELGELKKLDCISLKPELFISSLVFPEDFSTIFYEGIIRPNGIHKIVAIDESNGFLDFRKWFSDFCSANAVEYTELFESDMGELDSFLQGVENTLFIEFSATQSYQERILKEFSQFLGYKDLMWVVEFAQKGKDAITAWFEETKLLLPMNRKVAVLGNGNQAKNLVETCRNNSIPCEIITEKNLSWKNGQVEIIDFKVKPEIILVASGVGLQC